MFVHMCTCLYMVVCVYYFCICLYACEPMCICFFDKGIKDIHPFRRVKMIPICFSSVSEVRSYFHLIRLSKGSKISFVSHPAC